MKYCVYYDKNFKYSELLDETIYLYHDNIVMEITKREWREDKRVIIDIIGEKEDENIIPILQKCKQVHDNLAIKLNFYKHKELAKKLKELNIDYFYNNYANTIDEVYSLIKLGVSDIYIAESAGFNLIELGKYCKDKGVNVRVIPNVAQYKINYKEEIPDINKFFIRPEDTDIYEPYVDVFEFLGPDYKLSITFEIYRNKVWDGDLNKLIIGINDSIMNNGIPPIFGQERLKCNQKCMIEKCNLCSEMAKLSNQLKDNNLRINKTKDKEWQNESKSYKEAVQYVNRANSTDDGEVSEE
jgi:hypothetical protein